jgi:opacity protein-like surface antigen
MKRFCLLMLLAACALPAPAFAKAHTGKHPRVSWEQRFQEANATHDGRLTLDQAKAGYKSIVRHFQDIDTNGKGFVTENDIRAWRATEKERRHANKQPDPLRARPAFDRHVPGDDVRPPVVPGANRASATPPATRMQTVATVGSGPSGN